MKKILTIGEYLIDMMPKTSGVALSDVNQFIKKPGGAPINVAVGVHRLGGNAQVVTQVGKDGFGEYLIDVLKKEGMDVSTVYQTKESKTCLAFVSLDDKGERDFVFYRNPSADQLLNMNQEEINTFTYDIIHFGSVGLAEYPLKTTTDLFIEIAHKTKKIVSFDVNIREMLFDDLDTYKKTIKKYLNKAHIIKLSKEELLWLIHDASSIEEAVKKMITPTHHVILVSDGSHGVYAFTQQHKFFEASIKTHVVDTTGAGDGLMAGFLFALSKEKDISHDDWIQGALKIGVHVATKTIQKKGAMEALPRKI